jgi:hypothetical protein
MAYKSKYSAPPVWTYDEFGMRGNPEPYDCPSYAALSELVAPDGASVFLLLLSAHVPGADPCTYYGIEAPHSCPQRKAFEWGKMSWLNYWTHKKWLLKIQCPFDPGTPMATFITPDDMDLTTIQDLTDFNVNYPFELKRAQLEGRCYAPWKDPREIEKAEREYQQFMMKYGHRFSKIAA